MADFDFMTPENQALLPSHLRSNAYMQAGGTAGGYAPWVESNINKTLSQTPYSTYDPRFFQGQTDFTNAYGGHPLDRSSPVEMFDFNNVEEYRKRAMSPQVINPVNSPTDKPGTTEGTTPGTTPGVTPASGGAAGALSLGARSLKDRRPGLAGGFSGWSGENKSGTNSNFNYFSRFA